MTHFHRNLRQVATVWTKAGEDVFGNHTFTRSERACRWEDRSESILSKTGDETVSKAKVFFAEDIDVNGYLFLGTSTAADPSTVANAYEIRQVARVPDLRNIKTLYIAWV